MTPPKIRLIFLAFLFALAGSTAPLWADPVAWESTAIVASGGWGRMVSLSGQTWLAVSTVFPSNTNTYLSILVSSNDCRTWSPISVLQEPGRTLDNGELALLPNGNLLLTMRSLIGTTSFRLPVYVTANQGRSWTYLSDIDSSAGPGGLWEPHFQTLSNSALAVFYSNETHPGYSQIISERISYDQGTNWGPEIWASFQNGGGNLRPGMPQTTRMANGKYILVNEVVNLNNADVYCKTSNDATNWSNDLGFHIPCQHAGPFVAASPDGQVFVTSCQNEVSYSRDYGATWLRPSTPPWALGFNFSWPALYITASNELASMITWSGVHLRFGAILSPVSFPNPIIKNFDNATDADWTRYGGNFGFPNGAYGLFDTNTFGKALVGSEFWTDGTLESDVQLLTAGNAGLVFCMTNPDEIGPDDGFNYYAGLDTGGFVVFGRESNSWTQLATASMPVSTGSWYHLRVIMQGGLFRIFAQDMTTPKITWTDTAFTRGQVGVRAFQCNALFDNFSFSNAAPVALKSIRTNGNIEFQWPISPVNVTLFSAAAISAATAGAPVVAVPSFSNNQWSLSLPQPVNDQFFWLQGK